MGRYTFMNLQYTDNHVEDVITDLIMKTVINRDVYLTKAYVSILWDTVFAKKIAINITHDNFEKIYYFDTNHISANEILKDEELFQRIRDSIEDYTFAYYDHCMNERINVYETKSQR